MFSHTGRLKTADGSEPYAEPGLGGMVSVSSARIYRLDDSAL